MEFSGKCFLRPGPSAERPITFEVRNPTRDEDGSRASACLDLTIAEADDLARDLRHAIQWTTDGIWKPGPV